MGRRVQVLDEVDIPRRNNPRRPRAQTDERAAAALRDLTVESPTWVGDAAAVVAAAELNPEAKEPELQCLPSGRRTTVVTDDHDGVAIAAGDAAAVVAAEI